MYLTNILWGVGVQILLVGMHEDLDLTDTRSELDVDLTDTHSEMDMDLTDTHSELDVDFQLSEGWKIHAQLSPFV